jgi:hypothetical protein
MSRRFGAVVQAALLLSIPSIALAQGSGDREVYNVVTYGANGDDGSPDTTAIDQALAAVLTDGGGVLYFPPGRYIYGGTGLVVNSPNAPATPITIQGDGTRMSHILVTSLTNPEFIKLKSLGTMGNTSNWGMGVRDLLLEVPVTKDAITIENLESAVVENVNVYGSRNALNVVESRTCEFRNILALNYAGSGVKITGNLYASNSFVDLQLNGASGSGWAFDWVHTLVAPGEQAGVIYDGPAGPTLYNVITNVSGQGGFRFKHVGPGIVAMFPFCNNCVADGAFGAEPFLFQNIHDAYLTNSFAVNHNSSPGYGAYAFDQASGVSLVGGVAYSVAGPNGSDFAFRNACRDIVLSGVQTHGTHKTFAADETPHWNIVLDTGRAQNTTVPSDYHRLFQNPTSSARMVSPLHVLTNTHGNGSDEFALRFDENPWAAKYFRVNAASTLEILPWSHQSVISTLSDSGVWTAAGFVGPLTGNVNGIASGNLSKQPTGGGGTPDDAGVHVTGSIRGAAGVHTSLTNVPSLSGQLDVMDSASPAAMTGGLVNLGGGYGGGSATPFGAIQGYKANGAGGDNAGGLRLFTRSSGQPYVERVRIDEKGILSTSLGGSVASGATIAPTGNVFHVTGNASITSIATTGLRAGATLTLIFDGAATLVDGGTLKLAGNLVATADDTVELVWDGTNWYETRRSVN